MIKLWKLCALFLLLTLGGTLVPPVDAAPAGPDDPAEVAAFMDSVIPAQLESYNIPGAAVVVVKDGRILFAKGYGMANLRQHQPVVADETLFHIGSVTKLFTWTAVMQLAEQGKLDLHTDVNAYLGDFQIPATFTTPITMDNLLTHTPGFEDRLGHLYRLTPHDGLPLDRYVVTKLPRRVYPPGTIIAYSNYGAALAGYIVQRVSGMPYEQYIETHLFAPLDMRHSVIREPFPPALAQHEAMGYWQAPWGLVARREYFPNAPFVGLSATVTDIGHFMIAQLQDGRYGDSVILQPQTVREMQQQHFTEDPRLVGVTYGFVEWQRNGQRVLWHGGSTSLFQSLLMILPERNVGMFVAYNKKSAPEAGKVLRDAFLDHYYPVHLTPPRPMAGYRDRAPRFAGVYRESRWSTTVADKLVYAFKRTHRVTANPDGTIQLIGQTYVEVAPDEFHEVDGQGKLIFHEDASGTPTLAAYDTDPHRVLLRLQWYEDPSLYMWLLAFCWLVFGSTWFVELRLTPRRLWYLDDARFLPRWLSFLAMVYPVIMAPLSMTALSRAVPDLTFLAPFIVMIFLLALGLALAFALLMWHRRYGTLWERLYYTLVVYAALIYLWWLSYWNLLGAWRF